MSGNTSETRCKRIEPTPPEGEAVTEQKCERCDRPSKYKAAEFDADKGCWIHWTHPPFLGWNVCSAKSKLIGNKWVGEPAPVVSTAAPGPEHGINNQTLDTRVVARLNKALHEAKAVAPESYKPAEGPGSICLKCGKLIRKTSWIPALLGECDCENSPAATPVTVEAPEFPFINLAPGAIQKMLSPKECCHVAIRPALIFEYIDGPNRQGWMCGDCGSEFKLATPKRIGDAESVAQKCAEVIRHKQRVSNRYRDNVLVPLLREALSPFFAPAPPCSECATLEKVLDLVATDELFIQPADGGGWVFWVNVNDMFYPAADGEGIDLSEIPAVWNAWKEKGWPGVVRWVQEKRSGLKLRKSREEKILNIENLRTECATLRKERDEARSELEQWTKWGVVEVAVRNPQVADYCEHWEGRAEAAEAQLSTLRDALENKLNRALSDAKDLNGYATNDDGGLGMRLLKVACHTTGMIMRLERELKEIAAPTPEVAPKE